MLSGLPVGNLMETSPAIPLPNLPQPATTCHNLPPLNSAKRTHGSICHTRSDPLRDCLAPLPTRQIAKRTHGATKTRAAPTRPQHPRPQCDQNEPTDTPAPPLRLKAAATLKPYRFDSPG